MSTVAKSVRAGLVLVLLDLGAACSGSASKCQPGEGGCACGDKGVCAQGLSCQDGKCVRGAAVGSGGSTMPARTSKASGGASSTGVRSSSGGATIIGGAKSVGGSGGAGGVSSTGGAPTLDAGADARVDASPDIVDAPAGGDAGSDAPMVPPDARDAPTVDVAVDTAVIDAPPFVPPEQWLLDPSFEQPELTAWVWPVVVTPGNTTEHALFMDGTSANKWVSQTVDLRGYDAAQAIISASIKTENVVPGPNSWEQAALSVDMLDAAGKRTTQFTNFLFLAQGTQNYTHYQDSMMVPLGTVAIKVTLSLAPPANGKVWFDDVEMRLQPPSTNDDVTVPAWTPPTVAWCARPGYGLGTAMDADVGFDTQLYPHDADIAKNKRVARALFTQVTQPSGTQWDEWARGIGLEAIRLGQEALSGSGVLVRHDFGLWDTALPATGIAYNKPNDISSVMLATGFGIVSPSGSEGSARCSQTFAAPANLDTHAGIRERVLAHITETIGHMGGLPMWSVVNEIANANQQCFTSAFADPNDTEIQAGVRLLVTALNQAEVSSPGTIGLYNDVGLTDYLTTHLGDYNRARALALVAGVMAKRQHLDGIGSQGHLTCRGYEQTNVDIAECAVDTAAQSSAYDAFAAAGVPVYITEFDVHEYYRDGTDFGSMDPEQQGRILADYIRTALNHPGVLGVTMMGHRQNRMAPYLERAPGMTDAQYWPTGGGLYDDLYQPKPAYSAVVKVLQGYYADAGCDYLPGSRVAAVRGDAVEQTRFATTGTATLVSKGDAVHYLFNTPHGGSWQLELQLEADAPGPNIFNLTIDGANQATVTLDATLADGSVVEKATYAAPIALSRGTHRVRIELGADADTCTGAKTDVCDGWGIIRGLRLKRVGP